MFSSEEERAKLSEKLKSLREILKPTEDEIRRPKAKHSGVSEIVEKIWGANNEGNQTMNVGTAYFIGWVAV